MANSERKICPGVEQQIIVGHGWGERESIQLFRRQVLMTPLCPFLGVGPSKSTHLYSQPFFTGQTHLFDLSHLHSPLAAWEVRKSGKREKNVLSDVLVLFFLARKYVYSVEIINPNFYFKCYGL